jgi:glycosyltransferase involved in cell wall biosynthesis
MPKVSVIIPAYNSAGTVGRSVESALAQNFPDFEVVVVDDGSTDDTPRVLEEYRWRIKVVTQPNRGLAGARNSGAREAAGDYFAFLDADDTWTADKLAKTVDALVSNTDAVLAFSDATCVDETGAFMRSFMRKEFARAPSMDDMMAGRFQILPSSAVVRRDAFERVGGFREEFRGVGFEDVFFWILVREHGPFVYVPEQLVTYRVEPLVRRLEKYRPSFFVFERLMRAHYGEAGERLIRVRRQARVSAWGYSGLLAMNRGDVREARHAFRRAFEEDPARLKNLMRLLRTFLPTPIARALTGRTRKALQEPTQI